MFKKILIIILLVTSYELLVTNCNAEEEKVTITTYYPSPYGVYNEMRLYPHSPYTTACDSTQEGNMYYDGVEHRIKVCACRPSPLGCGWNGMSFTSYTLNQTLQESALQSDLTITAMFPSYPGFPLRQEVVPAITQLTPAQGFYLISWEGGMRANAIPPSTPHCACSIRYYIKLTDQYANVIASGGSSVVDANSDSTIYTDGDMNGEKVIYLPAGQNYTLSAEASRDITGSPINPPLPSQCVATVKAGFKIKLVLQSID